jgi:clan AA aspartic protease (TIGR02281 family)
MYKRILLTFLCIGFFFNFFAIKETKAQTTITMKKVDGIYTIPCNVNGLKLEFIFDTGASDVSVSLTEALFMLKNGYLKPEDILGKQNFTDATGKLSEGTKIILRKLEFEGLTLYNVEASVVHELAAPLLLGQSAMTKLGKFQLDPNNGTLTIMKGHNYTYDYSGVQAYKIKFKVKGI